MLNPTDLRPSARQGCSHADSHALGACWFLRPAPTWSGRDDAALDHSVNHNGARGHAEGCDGHTTSRLPCPALQAQLQGTTPANHPSATQLQLQLMVFTSLDSSVQLHGLHGLLQQVPPAKGHPVMGANHGTSPKTGASTAAGDRAMPRPPIPRRRWPRGLAGPPARRLAAPVRQA